MGDVLEEQAVGVESDFLEMMAQVRAWKDPVRPYPGFVLTIHQNVKQGVAAVLAHEARLARELPFLNITAVKVLPRMSSALGFAVRRVDRVARRAWSEEELKQKQADVLDHRRVLLLAAESLAASGLLKQEEVDRIKKGRGFIDRANDCVDVAALLRANQALVTGHLPFSWERVQQAATAGSEMADYLRPANSPQSNELTAEQKDGILVRDTLWTLVDVGYEDVFRAGAWVHGSAVEEHVPPLLSREMVRKPR